MNNHKVISPNHIANLLTEVFGTGLSKIQEEKFDFQSSLRLPRTNIQELEDSIILEMLVPGRSKDELKIFTENQVLTVSYEPKEQSTSTDDSTSEYPKFSLKEFKLQGFKRSFKLKDNLDLSDILASYEQGVLTLTIPKTIREDYQKKEVVIK